MSDEARWHHIPCPRRMDEGAGECEGQVAVYMDGDDWPATGRHSTGDVRPCPVCGFGAAESEITRAMDQANAAARDHDPREICDEDYDQ